MKYVPPYAFAFKWGGRLSQMWDQVPSGFFYPQVKMNVLIGIGMILPDAVHLGEKRLEPGGFIKGVVRRTLDFLHSLEEDFHKGPLDEPGSDPLGSLLNGTIHMDQPHPIIRAAAPEGPVGQPAVVIALRKRVMLHGLPGHPAGSLQVEFVNQFGGPHITHLGGGGVPGKARVSARRPEEVAFLHIGPEPVQHFRSDALQFLDNRFPDEHEIFSGKLGVYLRVPDSLDPGAGGVRYRGDRGTIFRGIVGLPAVGDIASVVHARHGNSSLIDKTD